VRTFAFIPDESFNGAVARWADEVGGVERMIDLTRVAGVRYGHQQRAASAGEADIRALAAEMGVAPGELLSRATPNTPGEWTNNRHPISFAGVTLPSLMIEKQVRRFSPSALARSPHHRALWDVRLLPACTETGEILLDRCGNDDCGRTGWSATLGIDRCEHCMTDLTLQAPATIPDETRIRLAEVAGLLSHDDHVRHASLALLPPRVAALGASNIVDLLTRIAPVVDRNLQTNLVGLLNAPPGALCAAVAMSWKVLINWPNAMGDIAATHVGARIGRHNDGNGGRTMRLLTHKRQLGASDAVLDLIATWRRSISVDQGDGAALRERTVSGTVVAQVTGLDTNKVVEYRRAGLFKTYFALDFERPEARYDAAEIDRIAVALADRSSVGAARRVLGTSCHGVEQLVAMRLLEGIDHPFLDAHYGARQISTRSLDALVAAIRGSSGGPTADMLSLWTAMKSLGGRLKPWGPVFAMLLAGELPYAMDDQEQPLADAIRIHAPAVPLLGTVHVPERVRATLSPSMSKVDAGELLNLSPAKITEMLATVVTGAGSHAKAVPLLMVERLARQNIAVAEIAARRGVSHLRAHLDAIAAGIPHLGAGGFCREGAEREFFR
jgi:hypothetical protein